MAILGTLAIGVTATVKKATQNLKSLKSGISGVGSVASGVAGKLAGISTAIAGIAGAAGLTALVKNSFASIDAVGKMSAKLGIGTENLIAFQHQASLAGIESGTFEKALQKMISGVDDATRGVGTAKDAFAALKLDPKDLASGSPENAYKRIADAIANTAGAQKQLALTTQIFGQRGADMIHIIREGSAGFEANRAAVEKLGLAYSSIDSIQVQNANDAVSTLGETIGGVANRIAIGLAPFVEEVANRFTNWIAKMNTGFNLTGKILDGVIIAIGFFSDLIYGLQLIWKAAQIAANAFLYGIALGVEAAIRALDALREAVGLAATGFLESASNLAQALGEQLDEVTDEFIRMGEAGRPSEKIMSDWYQIAAAAREAAAETAKVQQAAREAAPDFESMAAPTKKVEEIIAGLRRQLDQLTLPEELRVLKQLQDENATTAQIAEAKALLDDIKAAKLSSDLDKRAADILKDIQSPAEKLAQRIREIEEVGDRLTSEQRQAAIDKARKDIIGAGADVPAPAALIRGTVEARSAELAGLRRLKGEREQDKTLKDQLKTQRESNDTLKSILKAIEDGSLVVSDN